MRKFKYSVLTILLACVLVLSGCSTKAETAKWNDCNVKYSTIVSHYLADSNYIFTTKELSPGEQTFVVDLYSANAYNLTIFNAINADDFDETTDSMNFGLLKNGNEYQTLTYAIFNFFSKYSITVTEAMQNSTKDIPQQVFTNIYTSIENLESSAKNLVSARKNLNTRFATTIRHTNNPVGLRDFEVYLEKYQNFIDNLLDISISFQNLYFNYYHHFDYISGDEIKPGAYQRWVDSAILYCAGCYFMKDMKYSLNIQNAFGHAGHADLKFVEFANILKNYADKQIIDNIDDEGIAQYRVATKKLDSSSRNFEKYEQAVSKVNNYLKSNKLQQIDETRADYAEIQYHYEFTKTFEQNIQNIQNLLYAFTK